MKAVHLISGKYKFTFGDSDKYGMGMQTLKQLSNILESQSVASISARMTEPNAEDKEHTFDFIDYYLDESLSQNKNYLRTISDIMFATSVFTFHATSFESMELDVSPEVILEREIILGNNKSEEELKEIIKELEKEANKEIIESTLDTIGGEDIFDKGE